MRTGGNANRLNKPKICIPRYSVHGHREHFCNSQQDRKWAPKGKEKMALRCEGDARPACDAE